MKQMQTCCCGCCSVETGTKVLSILGIVSYVAPFFGLLRSLMMYKEDDWDKALRVVHKVDPHALVIAQTVFMSLGTIACILCAVGAFKRRRHYYIPHLVFQAIVLVEFAALIVVAIVVMVGIGAIKEPEGEEEDFTVAKTVLLAVMGFILAALLIYFILTFYYYFVVLSDYKNLEFAERNPQPSVQYTSVPGNAPPVYVGQGFPQAGQQGYAPQSNVYPSLSDKSQAV